MAKIVSGLQNSLLGPRHTKIVLQALYAFALSACGQTQVAQPPANTGSQTQGNPPPIVTLVRLSKESPYAPGFCQAVASEHGYEDNPSFAITPQGLITAWEQDHYNETPGAVVGYSFDGGRTWTEAVPPSAATCMSNPAASGPGVFEPGLAVDGLGTTFLLVGDNGSVVGRMSINTSHDGGVTWSQPTNLAVANGLIGGLTSGPTISADPSTPAAVSFTWVSHEPPDAVWFSRTADDGATWSMPQPVRLAPPAMINAGATILTLPSGTILIVATDFSYLDLPVGPNKNVIGAPHDVAAIRSTDHGANWSETKIADLSSTGFGSQPVLGPDDSVFELVADGAGADQVWSVFRSTDEGVSWTQIATHVPLPTSNVSPSHGDLNGADWGSAALAVAADGTMAILYDVSDADGKATNVLLTYSRDGGKSWNDLHLGGPFDLSALPTVGLGLGDYQVLSVVDGELAALFLLGPCTATPTDECPATTNGPSDLYFARISFPGAR